MQQQEFSQPAGGSPPHHMPPAADPPSSRQRQGGSLSPPRLVVHYACTQKASPIAAGTCAGCGADGCQPVGCRLAGDTAGRVEDWLQAGRRRPPAGRYYC
jgi:hypothetical protein